MPSQQPAPFLTPRLICLLAPCWSCRGAAAPQRTAGAKCACTCMPCLCLWSADSEPPTQPYVLQCGRFHTLDRFAPGMHSCREQLARHAERRRRARSLAAAGVPTGRSWEASAGQPSHRTQASIVTCAAAGSVRGLSSMADQPHHASIMPPLDGQAQLHSSPEVKAEPRSAQGGSSGSSISTHSTHQHSATPSAPAFGQRQQASMPAPSVCCDGMDVLLAAAQEEEELEQQQQQQEAGEAQRSPKRARHVHLCAAGTGATAGVAGLEPDLSWFTAPAAAVPAASQHAASSEQATTDGCLLLHLAQSSAVLPPLPDVATASTILPADHCQFQNSQQPGTAAPAAASALDVGLLLQQVEVARQVQTAPVPQHLPAVRPTQSCVVPALQQAAALAQEQAVDHARLQHLCLAHVQAAQQQLCEQQQEKVACLFKAAVQGLLSTILTLHAP